MQMIVSLLPLAVKLCILAVTTRRRHALIFPVFLSQTLTTCFVYVVCVLGRSPMRRRRKRQRADSFPTNGMFVFLAFHVHPSP